MRLRKLYEHPIFIQLVVFTVLIGIVPLILISGFVFYKMADMAREEVMDSHEQVILQYTDGVEEKLRQYQESVIQIANNTIILKTLAAGGFRRLYARQESQRGSCQITPAGTKNRDQQLHGLFYARSKPDLRTAREHVKRGGARGLVSEEKCDAGRLVSVFCDRAAGKSDGDRQDDPEYRRQQL